MTQLHHVERQIQACENSLREEKDKRRKYHVSTQYLHVIKRCFDSVFILNPVIASYLITTCKGSSIYEQEKPYKKFSVFEIIQNVP